MGSMTPGAAIQLKARVHSLAVDCFAGLPKDSIDTAAAAFC
jgi:hypothetical protein